MYTQSEFPSSRLQRVIQVPPGSLIIKAKGGTTLSLCFDKCLPGALRPPIALSHSSGARRDWLNRHRVKGVFSDCPAHINHQPVSLLFPWLEYKSSALPRHADLVHTLEGRDGLALILIESGADDAAIAEVDLALRLLLVRESVLHPFLVVALGVILAGVGATGLLSCGGRGSGLGTIIVRQSLSQIIRVIKAARTLTRKSTSSSTQEPQPDQSSRSCCGP